MATPPSDVRGSLVLVTGAAAAEVAAIAREASGEPLSALLAAVPGIVDYYLDGAAELALQWFEELREESGAAGRFSPEPVTPLYVDSLRDEMRAIAERVEAEVEQGIAELMAEQAALVTEEAVARGFRASILENVNRDPEAVGWRRFARPGACGFCKMLAERGAVYVAETARFAAHGAVMAGGRKGGNCMCIAGPAFQAEGDWEKATPLQYVASKAKRTETESKRVREYLRTVPDGFDAKGPEWLRQQIAVTQSLKDSPWRTAQLARLRARLAELTA